MCQDISKMSKNQVKLDEIRTILLSVLLTRKGPVPLPLLERDYLEMEENRIPYRQFGYTNVLEFLQSMPEHFVIEYYNGNHHVSGIASEKTKHVKSLVERQKIHHKPPPRFYMPPHLRQPFNRRIHHRSQQAIIAPDKLFLLMQYIKNNPNGVSLQNAMMFVQQKVPFVTISMSELRTQLQSQSHHLLLDGNMIYPTCRDLYNAAQQPQLQPLIEEPQEPRNEPQSNSRSSPIRQTVCAAGQEDFDDIQYFSDENDFVPVNCVNNYEEDAETNGQAASNLAQCSNYDMFNHNRIKNNDMKMYDDFATNNKRDVETKSVDLSEIISDRIKVRLEELIRKHPEGIWCADLPNLYLQEYKVQLNYTQFGFASVREFTSYLPKIFYMTQVNKTDDFILYTADKRPVVPKTEPIDGQTSHDRYDKYNSVQTQCDNDNNDCDEPIPLDVPPTITKNFAPNDVMNYNDNVEKIPVSELKYNKKYLEVYVVEVFHPSFFWIQLRENKKRFYQMMNELSDFYDCNRSKYTIAKVALKKDMNCACVYTGRWHRGIIKSVKPDFRVTVFFYDYGTLKTYSSEDVYYLHKKFSILPAQAIPCGLHDIKPQPSVGDRWKKNVVDQFIDKIADTLLAATVMTIDPTHNSMMIVLTDTSEEEDVHINDWLVKERLAQVGKTADTVDMASLMKYVVNNSNQLPTYCFAEENLMPDNCCKATLTEEKYEVPLVSSGSTLLHNYHQQQSVRPPPGFPPLDEQRVASNILTTSLHNDYSFANTSNAKTSVFNAEKITNPFLTDEFIPNDIIRQVHFSTWSENKKLQISVNTILDDLLEHSSLALKNQIQLNKILKIIEKVLAEQKDNCSTVTKTPSASNLANGMTLNDIDSAQKMSYNLNGETFVKQDLNTNTFSMSNPFSVNSDNRPQSSATFSNCSSDIGFPFNTIDWSQSNNSHMQMPPSVNANPAPSTFINHIPSNNTFLPSTKQDSKNIPMSSDIFNSPMSSTVPTNMFNNFSELLNSINIQFNNMLKDTNPFKYSVTDRTQVPETQNEVSHDYNAGRPSYLSAPNPQSHASKMETPNVHARTNCFTPAGHVSENYTPRIVYESGPVMYNTQKKQMDADARQNTCSNNLDTQNTQSLELGQDKKPTSQLANDIANSQHQVINQLRRDNSQVNGNYVTQSPMYYTQSSQPIINSESIYYQQNSNTNNLQPVLQSWNPIEIPEHRTNSKFQNSVPLSNHNKNTAFGTPITSSLQDWNCNNDKKSIPRKMNEATDSNYTFKFKDSHDKQRSTDTYANFWNSVDNGSVQNAPFTFDSFVFQKIDLVKGISFIFNIEHDGWILTNEFIEVFTNFKLQSHLLVTLEAMNTKVVFKEIQRFEYPLQFSQLDRYPLNVPRDSEKRIISINLISLQTALALLRKLKIVSREEIENAFKKNEFVDDSILPTLWILIVTYRDLKRRIELCSNYNKYI